MGLLLVLVLALPWMLLYVHVLGLLILSLGCPL
jgi:hypothetical protein